MKDRQHSPSQGKPDIAVSLAAFFREQFLIDSDPIDPVYQQRYAAEVINGFRVLSLIVFATMAILFLVHVVESYPVTLRSPNATSLMTCAVLALAGAMGLLMSKRIRSPAAALTGAAVLLVGSVAVLTVDRLQQSAYDVRPAPSLNPIIFAVLMLGATALPLRPARVFGLGVLLLLGCAVAASFTHVQVLADAPAIASAAMVVAVSVVIAARSTSQRIRVHHAYHAALEAEREAETTRARALLAESAVTMERLAASLSHELNTPIGALNSATETLSRGVQRHASFPAGSRMPGLVQELTGVIVESTARLSQTVARIQRFANLDRSAIRLVDINQLVQDAVALMNPPSAIQSQVVLNLQSLPQVWCRPHELSVAVASTLNAALERGQTVTIDTYAQGTDLIVKVTQHATGEPAAQQQQTEPGFGVVGGRVRATGWELFAARQLVRQTGGNLLLERAGSGEQIVMINLPANAVLPANSRAASAA